MPNKNKNNQGAGDGTEKAKEQTSAANGGGEQPKGDPTAAAIAKALEDEGKAKNPPIPPVEREQEQEELELEVDTDTVDLDVTEVFNAMGDIHDSLNKQLLRTKAHPALTVLNRKIREAMISARGLGVKVTIPQTIATMRSPEQEKDGGSNIGKVVRKAETLTTEQRQAIEDGKGKKPKPVTAINSQGGKIGEVTHRSKLGQAPPPVTPEAKGVDKSKLSPEERTRQTLDGIAVLSKEDFSTQYTKLPVLKSLGKAINEQEKEDVITLGPDASVESLQSEIHTFLTKGK